MLMMVAGVAFVALGLLLFFQGAHLYGSPDREAIIQKYVDAEAKYNEASEWSNKAAAIYTDALAKYSAK